MDLLVQTVEKPEIEIPTDINLNGKVEILATKKSRVPRVMSRRGERYQKRHLLGLPNLVTQNIKCSFALGP